MPYCVKCGTKNADDSRFCANCGSALGTDAFGQKVSESAQEFAKKMQESADRVSENVRRETERWGRVPPEIARTDALLGSISAGAVLVIIALSFLRYPGSLTALSDYFRAMGEVNAFIRPPAILIDGAIFFFSAVGLWSFVMALLRILVQRSARKALNDVLGGLFAFYVAYLLSAYGAFRIGGLGLLAFGVVGLGLLIIVQGIIRVALPWPRNPSY